MTKTMSQLSMTMYKRVLCVILSVCFASGASHQNVNLKIGEAKMVELKGKNGYVITVNNIPKESTHVFIQAHTHFRNLTLSNTHPATYTSSISGHNVGLVKLLSDGQDRNDWYLSLQPGDGVDDANALLHAAVYTEDDPVPGGCNLEFPVEYDPNSHSSFRNFVTKVIYQWSNIGYPRTKPYGPPSCENPRHQKRLSYHTYLRYLKQGNYDEREYFRAMKKMLTADLIQKHGRYLNSNANTKTSHSTFDITSRPGQGVILVVVVTQEGGGNAIYVPSMTYNCDVRKNVEDECGIKRNVSGKVLTVFALIIGIFLCFFGHRWFKTELVIFGFLAFSLLTVITVMRVTDFGVGEVLGIAAAFGVLGGALSFILWWGCGVPALSVLLPGLVAGYLFASVVFATPFGNLDIWSSPVNYGLAFAFATLLIPCLLLAFTRILNVFACTFVGSYLLLLLPDYYLYGSMQYFLVSSIRKAAYNSYLHAIAVMPFQTQEMAMSAVWGILFITACTLQYVRERKRPKFPPPPRQPRDHIPRTQHIPIPHPVSERTPLLPQYYSATPTAPPPPAHYNY